MYIKKTHNTKLPSTVIVAHFHVFASFFPPLNTNTNTIFTHKYTFTYRIICAYLMCAAFAYDYDTFYVGYVII